MRPVSCQVGIVIGVWSPVLGLGGLDIWESVSGIYSDGVETVWVRRGKGFYTEDTVRRDPDKGCGREQPGGEGRSREGGIGHLGQGCGGAAWTAGRDLDKNSPGPWWEPTWPAAWEQTVICPMVMGSWRVWVQGASSQAGVVGLGSASKGVRACRSGGG